MAKAPAPLLALKAVRLMDGATPLFDGVDIALEPRMRACLVGRNGAGKSTLLKIMAGQVLPDEGERFLQPGARLAYVPQEPMTNLDPSFTVGQQFAFAMRRKLGLTRAQTRERALALLARVDIKDPARNITWVPPEGGSGPNYVGM